MTAFFDFKFVQKEDATNQIKELQRAFSETSQKLEEVRLDRLRIEEESDLCKREIERRMELRMGNTEIVDALQQLGNLLQEEKDLSKKLDEQAASHRNEMSILEERHKSASSTVQRLTAEIQEVKVGLAELKACGIAAPASSPLPSSKSKRKPRKKV